MSNLFAQPELTARRYDEAAEPDPEIVQTMESYSLRAAKHARGTRGPVLVLPNGYGTLKYLDAVTDELCRHCNTVFSVGVRGQPPNSGELSIPGAAADVEAAAHQASQAIGGPLTLIVHCSAMLFLLHNRTSERLLAATDQVVLYAYLARPKDHLPRFRRKAEKYGVALADDLGLDPGYGPHQFGELPLPITVLHAKTQANERRANDEDLANLQAEAPNVKIQTPPRGYEILQVEQRSDVRQIVADYMVPTISDGAR